jgi:hypothetical protein
MMMMAIAPEGVRLIALTANRGDRLRSYWYAAGRINGCLAVQEHRGPRAFLPSILNGVLRPSSTGEL